VPRRTDPADDSADDVVGSDGELDQGAEENPDGIEPKAGYPSKDPRHEDHPYQHP
jgi:hypothetical protein